MHERLLEGMLALPCPAVPHEIAIGTGRVPNASVGLAVGDGIKLADGLKILVQYARVLECACRKPESQIGKFLAGHSETCTGALAWLAGLVIPLRDVRSMEPTYERYLDLWAQPDGGKHSPDEQLAFEVHQAIPEQDVDFTRYLLSLSFPGSHEYDVLVAQNILRLNPGGTLADFRGDFEHWRDRGLLHCLLVAARFMPTLNDWLAVEEHREAAWWGEMLTELNGAKSMDDVEAAVRDIGLAFGEGSLAGTHLAAVLDRIGVLMRVKSNSTGRLFDDCLESWKLGGHSRPHQIWARAKHQLESSLPPSLLCPRLFGAKRGSWGYSNLSLAYANDRLFIEQLALEYVPKCELIKSTCNPKLDPAARIQVCLVCWLCLDFIENARTNA